MKRLVLYNETKGLYESDVPEKDSILIYSEEQAESLRDSVEPSAMRFNKRDIKIDKSSIYEDDSFISFRVECKLDLSVFGLNNEIDNLKDIWIDFYYDKYECGFALKDSKTDYLEEFTWYLTKAEKDWLESECRKAYGEI